MAHVQQSAFCLGVKAQFPDYFLDSFVLDIGSFDVNGNNQYLFESCCYLGVDLMPGKNVDIVASGHELHFPDDTFDVVISTETAEHDRHYKDTLINITRMLKPGGLFVFSCATTGRAEHGTRRTTPLDAPALMQMGDWADYYQNIDENDFRKAVDVGNVFASFNFSIGHDTHDLYFWGVKKGQRQRRTDYSFQIREQQTLLNQQFILSKGIAEAAIAQSKTLAEANAAMRDLNTYSVELQRRIALLEGHIVKFEDRNRRRVVNRLKRLLRKLRATLTGTPVKKWTSVLANSEPITIQRRLYFHDGVYILTSKHTIFVAMLIQDALKYIDVKATIIYSEPSNGFADCPHFVICPNIFKRLPRFYVAFQMEQSVSPRWFTTEYFNTLERSFAIFDYSIANLKYLQSNGLSPKQMFHMPLSPLLGLRPREKDDHQGRDVLFYGDPSGSRRQTMLMELKKHFDVEVLNEVFGDDAYNRISKAKIIVNIHYYEDALLETTRIYECLSLGKLVVSERGADQQAHSNIELIVEFVDAGDVTQMVDKISRLLSSDALRAERLRRVQDYVNSAPKDFLFYFMRFLLALMLSTLISFMRWRETVGD